MRRLIIVLLVPAAFIRGRHVFEGGVYSSNYGRLSNLGWIRLKGYVQDCRCIRTNTTPLKEILATITLQGIVGLDSIFIYIQAEMSNIY